MLQSNRNKTLDQEQAKTVQSIDSTIEWSGKNGDIAPTKGTGYSFSSETDTQVMQIRRTDRLRRAVNLTCQAIIRGYDEDAILSECCRYLVDEGGYRMAWIGLSSDDMPAQLVPKAHAGLAVAMDELDRLAGPTQALLQKSALRCVEKRSPQVVRPDPPTRMNGDTAPDHAEVPRLTVCAVPMELGPHGHGALSLCIDDPEAFKAEEVALLRELANDLGHGISMLLDRARTEHREQRLLQDREFHDTLFQHSREGIFVASMGGRLMQANPTFARLLGYPDADSLLGDRSASLYTIFTPREKNRLMAALDDDKAPQTHELMMRRKDSASVPVKVTVQPIPGPQGKYLQAFVEDVSALTAERKRRAEYAAMVEALHTPVFKVDNTGSIEYWNKAAERQYGFHAEETLGQPYPKALLNGNRAPVEEQLIDAIQDGRQVAGVEVERKDAQGSIRKMACAIRPVTDPDGRRTGSLVIEEPAPTNALAADTAPASHAPEHTPPPSTAKLYAMSYALKNAMTPILNHAQLLADRVGEQDANRKSVLVINRNASHAAKLLHALDAAMRPERQTDTPKRATKIDSVLRQAVNECSLKAQRRGVELVQNETPSTVLDVDATELQQAITQLLENAIIESKRGSKVKIRASRATNELRFSITDNGRRVTDQELQGLFKSRFGPDGQEQKGRLEYAKSVIERHEGRLWAEHAPGKGKTLRFILPTDRMTSMGSPPQTPSSSRTMQTESQRAPREPDTYAAASHRATQASTGPMNRQ